MFSEDNRRYPAANRVGDRAAPAVSLGPTPAGRSPYAHGIDPLNPYNSLLRSDLCAI